MTDVSVVALSVGEATPGRALASLGRQTAPPAEVVQVRRVVPFHRALNAGAARIRTPYFLQLDADMVLDAECIELLRAAMGPGVAIVVGALRDPLMGRIAGVKLFRRACFEQLRMRDSITQDVDFYRDLGERGWLTLCLTRYRTGAGPMAHTFGEHRPNYTPEYTYGTYHQLGARYRHRGDLRGLQWRFERLRRSDHPLATVARLALGHGVFSVARRDVPKPRPGREQLAILLGILEVDRERRADAGPAETTTTAMDGAPEDFLRLGRRLRSAGDFAAICRLMRQLGAQDVARSWRAEATIAHGLLATNDRSALAGSG